VEASSERDPWSGGLKTREVIGELAERPLADARGADPRLDREGVPMGLRVAESDEDALGGTS
jgi:hypothetical protein